MRVRGQRYPARPKRGLLFLCVQNEGACIVAFHCDKGMSETNIISSFPLHQLLNVYINAVPVYDYNQSHLTASSSAALAGTACDLFTLRQEQLDRDVHAVGTSEATKIEL